MLYFCPAVTVKYLYLPGDGGWKSCGKRVCFTGMEYGMITCSTILGSVICKIVWNMNKKTNTRYLEMALSGIPENFSGKMLEVPIGTGVLTMPVKTLPDARIHRLDYSADMMATARRGDVGVLPYETAESLKKRFDGLYQSVKLETVESMACFTCTKGGNTHG